MFLVVDLMRIGGLIGDNMKDKLIATSVLIVVFLFTCLMIYAIWDDASSPKINLSKSEWECSKTEIRITNVLIGGKLMPQSRQECIEYKQQ